MVGTISQQFKCNSKLSEHCKHHLPSISGNRGVRLGKPLAQWQVVLTHQWPIISVHLGINFNMRYITLHYVCIRIHVDVGYCWWDGYVLYHFSYLSIMLWSDRYSIVLDSVVIPSSQLPLSFSVEASIRISVSRLDDVYINDVPGQYWTVHCTLQSFSELFTDVREMVCEEEEPQVFGLTTHTVSRGTESPPWTRISIAWAQPDRISVTKPTSRVSLSYISTHRQTSQIYSQKVRSW